MEVTLWNSAEYRILCKSDFTSAKFQGIFHYFIPRNFSEFHINSAEFLVILCTEFCIRNISANFIQETIDFFVLKAEVEFKNINFAYFLLK
jgi:hypothetical protein